MQVYEVRQALIAAPSASGKQIRAIVDACKHAEISFKTLPALAELTDGKVSVNFGTSTLGIYFAGSRES